VNPDTPRRPWAESASRWLRGGFELLTQREKAVGASLAFAITAQGLLDALAVTMAMAFVGIVVEPGLVAQTPALQFLYGLLRSPDYTGFMQRLAALVLTLLGANVLVGFLLQRALGLFVAACQTRLARQLLQECVEAPYAWFLTRNATTLARFFYDDVGQWSRGFVQRLMTIVNAVITALVGTALLLVMAPFSGLAALALVAGTAAAVVSRVRPQLERLSRQKRAALERTMLAVTQVLSGIKDVKLSSRAEFFLQGFAESYAVTSRTHARLNAWQQVVPAGLPLLGQFVLIAVALFLISSGQSRGAVAGAMALLILVSSRVVPAISQLSTAAGLLATTAPALDAIHELRRSLDEERRRVARPATEPWNAEWRRLILRDVGYRYPAGTLDALRGISLELEWGKAYGVAGPSGAGKSTLVDLLLGLLDPSSGEMLVDGRALGVIGRAAWQACIGYVPQAPYIADDSLRANVAFGVARKQVDDAWVLECLQRANLRELLEELPQGLDTPLGDRGARLSGGQRQRIAIARALYNRPRLLVLDEATSALDRISEQAIQVAIDALRGNLTSVTIAHRQSTIRACDVIFLLERGQLAGQGRYDQLLSQSALFRKLATEKAVAEPAATVLS
jgi:ABC-type multidrug transport system fused ATPase/permease subunit